MQTDDSDDEIVCLTPTSYVRGQKMNQTGRGKPGGSIGRRVKELKDDREFGLAGWGDDLSLPVPRYLKSEDETSWESLTSEGSFESAKTQSEKSYEVSFPEKPSRKGRETISPEPYPPSTKVRRLSVPASKPSQSSSYYERLFRPTVLPNPLYRPPSPPKTVATREASYCAFKCKERPKSPSMLRDLDRYRIPAKEIPLVRETVAENSIILPGNNHGKSFSTSGGLVSVGDDKLKTCQETLVELSDSDTDVEILDDDKDLCGTNLSASSSDEAMHLRHKNDSKKIAGGRHPGPRSSSDIRQEVELEPQNVAGVVEPSRTGSQQNNTSQEETMDVSNAIYSSPCDELESEMTNDRGESVEHAVVSSGKRSNYEISQQESDKNDGDQSSEQVETVTTEVVAHVLTDVLPAVEQEDYAFADEKDKCDGGDRIVHPENLRAQTSAYPSTIASDNDKHSCSHTATIVDESSKADTECKANGSNHKQCTFEDSKTLNDKEDTTKFDVIAEIEMVPFNRLDNSLQHAEITEFASTHSDDSMQGGDVNANPISDSKEQAETSFDCHRLSKRLPPLQNFAVGINQVSYEPSLPAWYTGTFKRIKEVLSKRKVART